ncbi:MAG TPA: 50S ribosomal protein L17 [Candidatus Pacearchaeota archaeon]|jgi:large subunit ribosomal protein L17|nr:50S ribosomal protein L17 [Candidatus Pacearchaeota archaeon]HRR95050.1 50S ribosomal protein L17 [Candidatus Paceibacterota bacterium]HPC30701.1 50S ribosomal protein L17 [Candidatus Pacearchaeota archaeon]HQG09418.1 50S ribosomal protein L17 [Candidatus Pacearchaeota archaeon]HQH20181.1 50S ribosomal protein L17 [Candidatus Pacearchaeota archaeon]
MKKLQKGRKLHREVGQRKALLKSLASSLILRGKITTTEAKAKELAPFIEKKITKAKIGTVASRRYLSQFFSPKVVKKLVDEIAVKYKDRKGGYTRIIKLGQRKSDSSKMAIIELV